MKKIAIFPYDGFADALTDRFFEPLCYTRMRTALAEKGYETHTLDMFGGTDDIDGLICFDVPKGGQDAIESVMRRTDIPKIAVLYEAPVIKPHNYRESNLGKFNYVLTWNRDLVDQNNFFHFFWPQLFSPPNHTIPFGERKVLSLIAGNKMVYTAHELYSERRRAARFFERHLPDQFDLYGRPAWNKRSEFSLRDAVKPTNLPKTVLTLLGGLRPFRSYRGETADKLRTLARYKFSVCYENMDHINGYVTEKIWDCFSAGTVPIYLGANNVNDLIPKECYIDKRDFPRYEDLSKYLTGVTKERHAEYLIAARQFMLSDQARPWHHKQWGLDAGNLLADLLAKKAI